MNKVNRWFIFQVICLETAVSGVSIQTPVGHALHPKSRGLLKGFLKSSEWRCWGSPTLQRMKATALPGQKGHVEELVQTQPREGWRHSRGEQLPGMPQGSRKRARRKYQHVPSPILCSLAGDSHYPSPMVGQPAQGLRGCSVQLQPPSTQQGREGQKLDLGLQWESVGMVQTENNQYIWLLTGLQLYILSARAGEMLFIRRNPLSTFRHLMHTQNTDAKMALAWTHINVF